jgi:hypothetical protein
VPIVTKTNAIITLSIIILLIICAKIAEAGSRAEQSSTPRVTVSIAQIANAGTEISANTNKNINQPIAQNSNNQANANNETSENTNTNTSNNNSTTTSSASADANATASSSAGDGGSSDISVEGDEAAASGAAPIFLSSGDDTCMGSSGVGGQGVSFGFSLGTTWTDENCIMLKNARELKNHGHHKAAKARLCMNEDNALAFELAGEPCPRALPSTQAALETIRQWNPNYQAATNPDLQVAALGDVVGLNGQVAAGTEDLNPSSNDEPQGAAATSSSPIGTLIAMVTSAIDHIASNASGDIDSDLDSVTAMDGIE